MKLFAPFLTLLILFNTPCLAKKQEKFDMAAENLAGEYAECTAYFEIIMAIMQQENEPQTEATYKGLRDQAMLYALVLSQKGRDKDMAINVVNSKIELAKNDMRKATDNRNENISILINKYQDKCIKTVKTPDERVIRSMTEISKQQSN